MQLVAPFPKITIPNNSFFLRDFTMARKSPLSSFFALLLSTLLFSAFLVGCASTLPPGKPAYVYVAENGLVTFRGETLKAPELPEKLRRAGAKPTTHIMIIAQGDVPSAFLTQMAIDCGHAGFPSCTIREKMRISIEKAPVK